MAQKRLADPETDDLEKYFTNVEYLRGLFATYITAQELPKRILAIHGVGGVGKSSLLRMFSLHAKNIHVPIANTSAEESKSVVDVLANWLSDLKTDGITLGNFQKTLVHYKAIQTKVEDEVKKAQEARKKAAEKVGTAVAKAVIGAVISLIPGGAIVNALGGIGVDALVDWLSGFLTKPDIDLLIDPTKALSKDFLEDIAKVAHKHRLILMLDTFEQMSALNDWVCGIAKQLDENILLVITGREMINWDRQWDGWLAHTQVEELEPMTEDIMRELARRYYATMMGGEPDPKQVEAIIAFARGLPMALATSVRLWVKYGQKFDIEEHKAEVYGDVVKRLREGVPPELLPILESAAIVRWFDRPILRAITKLKDVSAAYEELRCFPFVKSSKEGLRLHDSVREIMEENIRIDDPERHKDLHERAAKYFEKQISKSTSEEVERLELERLYHRVRKNERTGIKLFQETAEVLARYRLVNKLRALVNDVNTYSLQWDDSRFWREYYQGVLLDSDGSWLDAEKIFRHIAEIQSAPHQLRSYALGRWGLYLARPERLAEFGGSDKAIQVLSESIKIAETEDINTAYSYWEIGVVYQRLSKWDKAWDYFERFNRFASSLGKTYLTAYMKSSLKDPYAKTGDWRKLLTLHQEINNLLDEIPNSSDMKADLLHTWTVGLIWMGRYSEAEATFRDALSLWDKRGVDASYAHRYIGYCTGLQDRFIEAEFHFEQAVEESKRRVAMRGNFDLDRALLLHYSFWAPIHTREGDWTNARFKFLHALALKRKQKDYLGFPELFVGLGSLYETQKRYGMARSCFSRCLQMRWTSRRYFECCAITGLVRVKHAQGEYNAIPSLLTEAEQLAQQYEYNDHLASLRLTQGHIAWEQKSSKIIKHYQHALVYALRYNRFLLDEILSGRSQGTPLRPIIPFCLEHGEDGHKMLMALQEWWKTGANDVGAPRLDTISPIPENIPLLEAEKLVRKREPSDGLPQKTVLEQIEAALKTKNRLLITDD